MSQEIKIGTKVQCISEPEIEGFVVGWGDEGYGHRAIVETRPGQHYMVPEAELRVVS